MTTMPVKSASHPKRELRKQLEIQLGKVLAGLLQNVSEKKLKKHINKVAHQLTDALVDYRIAADSHQGNAPKAALPEAIKIVDKIAKPRSKKVVAKSTRKVIKKVGK